MGIATYLLIFLTLNLTNFCQSTPLESILQSQAAFRHQDPTEDSLSNANQDRSNKAGQFPGSGGPLNVQGGQKTAGAGGQTTAGAGGQKTSGAGGQKKSGAGGQKTSGAGEEKSAGGAKVDTYKDLKDSDLLNNGKYYEVEYLKTESGDSCTESFRVEGKQEPTAVVKDTFPLTCKKNGPFRKVYYSDNTILLGDFEQDILIFGQQEDPDKLIVFKDGKCKINIYRESGPVDSKPLDEGTCKSFKGPLSTLIDEYRSHILMRSKELNRAITKIRTKVTDLTRLEPTTGNKAGQVPGSGGPLNGQGGQMTAGAGGQKTAGAGEEKSAGGAKVDTYKDLKDSGLLNNGKYYEVEYLKTESGDSCTESFNIKGKQAPTAVVKDTFPLTCKKDGPFRKVYYSDNTILLGDFEQDTLIFGQQEDPDKLIVFKDGKCKINIYSESGPVDSKPLEEGACESFKDSLSTLINEWGCPIEVRNQQFVEEAKTDIKTKVTNLFRLKPTAGKSVEAEVKADIITNLLDIIKALFTALIEKLSSLCSQDKDKGKTDKDGKAGKDA